MATLELTAPDISCGHCKSTIENDLGTAPGIDCVDVEIDSKTVHVVFDDTRTDAQSVRDKLADIGYPAS